MKNFISNVDNSIRTPQQRAAYPSRGADNYISSFCLIFGGCPKNYNCSMFNIRKDASNYVN